MNKLTYKYENGIHTVQTKYGKFKSTHSREAVIDQAQHFAMTAERREQQRQKLVQAYSYGQ